MRGIYKKLTYEDKFARKFYCNSYRFLPDMKRRNQGKLRRILKEAQSKCQEIITNPPTLNEILTIWEYIGS